MTGTHEIKGGEGITLHVREGGTPSGLPIIFLHGMFQSGLCWENQFQGLLAEKYRLLALDLRGHGNSEKPKSLKSYIKNSLWADDLSAVICQLSLVQPAVAAWSYGGYVVCDYLEKYGCENLSCINLASTPYLLTEEKALCGPGLTSFMEGLLSKEPQVVAETTRKWIRSSMHKNLMKEEMEKILEYNMAVPQHVRRGMVARVLDYSRVLKKTTVPVLVSFGSEDDFILPRSGYNIHKLLPNSIYSVYEGGGHALFMEEQQRFDHELDKLIQSARTPSLSAA